LLSRPPGMPPGVERPAPQPRARPVRYLNAGPRRPPPADFHWIYVPEERYPFYRVGIYSNAVPSMAPAGHGSLYVELSDRGPLPRLDDILPDIARALHASTAINSPDDVLFAELKEIKYAYVVFDRHHRESVATVTAWCEANHIHPRGRYGSWTYNAMEDCILAG